MDTRIVGSHGYRDGEVIVFAGRAGVGRSVAFYTVTVTGPDTFALTPLPWYRRVYHRVRYHIRRILCLRS